MNKENTTRQLARERMIISLETQLWELPEWWNGKIEDATSGLAISPKALADWWSLKPLFSFWIFGYFRADGTFVTPVDSENYKFYPDPESNLVKLFQIMTWGPWGPEAVKETIHTLLSDLRLAFSARIEAVR